MGRIPRSGDVIDGRFTIEHLAGSGGMGQVYRARDLRSGGHVALKVMHDAEKLEIERFVREANVLATLSHPGIVRYIDSGATADGEPYLVMEWLSGETLSTRLQRTQITLAETLALGRRVASALGAIHRRGVVHRDIKPSNLFLRNNAIEDVALIDFGTARRPLPDHQKLTTTGTMLGTPGYIAPEQVYNVPNLDGRADIFSLGCVLYRCISGQAPFRGHDALRMLLNGSPDLLPRLRELRPSVPQELDDLVTRMLSRSPDDRPHNGDVVAAELLAIEEREPRAPTPRTGLRSVLADLMATERRMLSLVIVRPEDEVPGARPLPAAEREAQERALRATVERHRGKLEILAGGSMIAAFSHADAATDLAARAARCALALRGMVGGSAIVLVSGCEVLGPSLPESMLIDSAVDLLESTGKGKTIRIDELTSTLLRNRFDTGSTRLHLRGELNEPDRLRLRFAEPTPFVGRDQELAQLETIFERCAEEHVASMALVTGPAGAGKARLAHEFLRRLEARGQPVEIWLGEADPTSSSAVLIALAQVLRHAFGLTGGESIEARRGKIRARVGRHAGLETARISELLGELLGTPFGDDPGGELAAVRQDPITLSGQIGQAILAFLRAECAVRPVVIVLEDLQWADLPTIKLVDATLGALADQPLMVLALARTEVHEIFPQLWADRAMQEIRLRKLSRRACEQWARQVLGEPAASQLSDEVLRALVERSEGHPFYLEAMLRAAAKGKGEATPGSVLAMVQVRLERLDPEARRVLRAASVFGETFWAGGVEALVGSGNTAVWLTVLVEQDVIAIKDDRRFPAEVEYRFRQPLVQEAAYAMLTEGDRVAGHWLAGQWLEQVGETDAKILEDHFERCGRGG
jgi:eukaryotic-like serine/threonine-protein kinase